MTFVEFMRAAMFMEQLTSQFGVQSISPNAVVIPLYAVLMALLIPASVSAEDQRQILDLISASSYAYDGKDLEGYLVLYAEDCVWEVVPNGATKPTVRAANREELRTLAAQRFAMLREKGIQSRHYQTNTVLSARADRQVEGTTMLVLMWQVQRERPCAVTTGCTAICSS